MAQQGSPDKGKRAHVEVPANWAKMTDDEKQAAAEAMATAIQKKLGVKGK